MIYNFGFRNFDFGFENLKVCYLTFNTQYLKALCFILLAFSLRTYLCCAIQYEVYLSNVVESTGCFVDLFNAYHWSSFTSSPARHPARDHT